MYFLRFMFQNWWTACIMAACYLVTLAQLIEAWGMWLKRPRTVIHAMRAPRVEAGNVKEKGPRSR